MPSGPRPMAASACPRNGASWPWPPPGPNRPPCGYRLPPIGPPPRARPHRKRISQRIAAKIIRNRASLPGHVNIPSCRPDTSSQAASAATITGITPGRAREPGRRWCPARSRPLPVAVDGSGAWDSVRGRSRVIAVSWLCVVAANAASRRW